MGTRHLIAVYKDGEHKIAQYGQWDGYPEGQGVDVLKFLRRDGNREILFNRLDHCRFIDKVGRDKQFIDDYEENAPRWSNEPDNRTVEQKVWFNTFMSRDLGAEILTNVSFTDGECILKDMSSFALDSLFCEWAYVIDFDTRSFEIYEGFQQEPHYCKRFEGKKKDGYYPVKMIKSYSLDELPEIEEFKEFFEKYCEEHSD